MAKGIVTRDIDIVQEGGTFTSFFKRITGEHTDYNFQGIEDLRKLLTNEKAKILHTIKTKKPSSIYNLAKMLNRDFKSVSLDVKLLQKFGLITLTANKQGRRRRLKPSLTAELIHINLRI